jgi:hypothetical protein
MPDDMALIRITGPKREDMAGGWIFITGTLHQVLLV